MRTVRAMGFVLCLVISVGCTDEETRVRVHLSADDAALEGVDTLSVRVQSDGRIDQVDSFAVTPRPNWSFVLDLRPADGDGTRRYTLVLELSGTGPSSRQRVISGYMSGERRELRLRFDAACSAVLCEGVQSCFEGACVDACALPTRRRSVERTEFIGCDDMDGGIADARLDAVDTSVPCDPAPDMCVDGDVVRCVDGRAVVESCNVPCDLEASCRQVIPSNVGEALLDEVSPRELVIPAGETWTIDTTEGADPVVRAEDSTGMTITPDLTNVALTPITPIAPPADSLFVVGVRSLTVEAGGTLRAVGSRALLIRASEDVTIEGLVTVASTSDSIGAGGATGGSADGSGIVPGGGCCPGGAGTRLTGQFVFSAGGGGSNGSRGGRGGDGIATEAGDLDQSGGNGGLIDEDNPTLTPLLGGSGGGSGAPRQRPSIGGTGGGALQITAGAVLRIAVGGVIDASGGGGGAGGVNGTAGAGGGSGGSILLEAARVELLGTVGANGGGGGAGHNNAVPEAGADGVAFDGAALGGTASAGEGEGGDGNWIDTNAQDGEDDPQGGGGGGGGGRIRINDLSSARSDFVARVSPNTAETFTVGRVATTLVD